MLIESFLELVESGSQVLLTTHSPNLVQLIPVKYLRFISKDLNNQLLCIEKTDGLHKIVETLGILPSLTKVVVCVEGRNDENFIKAVNDGISEFKSIIDISNLSFIPLNGGNLSDWNNRNVLANTNVAEFHIYDNDVNEYAQQVQNINDRNDKSSGVLTKRREMENYIPEALVCSHFGIVYNGDNWNEENIPKFICDQLNHKNKETMGSNLKTKSISVEGVKKIINGSLSKQITKDNLDPDAFEEIKSWFEQIKSLEASMIQDSRIEPPLLQDKKKTVV